jgi:hypothetical protein
MGDAVKQYVQDELTLELVSSPAEVRLAWRGKSSARDPSRFLAPILSEALELAQWSPRCRGLHRALYEPPRPCRTKALDDLGDVRIGRAEYTSTEVQALSSARFARSRHWMADQGHWKERRRGSCGEPGESARRSDVAPTATAGSGFRSTAASGEVADGTLRRGVDASRPARAPGCRRVGRRAGRAVAALSTISTIAGCSSTTASAWSCAASSRTCLSS